jgi:type II secretory pathway pseudopilin PulG
MQRQSAIQSNAPPGRRAAFTLTDLLVGLAALAVVAAAVMPPVVAARREAQLARCTANLQQIDQAVLAFAHDNGGALPAPVAGQKGDLWWWYKEQVKPYAGLKGPSSTNDAVFACPNDRGYSDPRPFHDSARFDYNSYVFNGVFLPGTPNIAGWPLTAVKQPQRTLLVMEWTAHAPLSWHYSRTGRNNLPFYCDAQSVVGFVDGHVSFTKIYYDGYNAAFTQDPIAGYDYQYSGN